jgi:hypothetical protein
MENVAPESSVNTNTETATATDAIEITGGASPASFDELENVSQTKEYEAKEDAKSRKAAEAQADKELDNKPKKEGKEKEDGEEEKEKSSKEDEVKDKKLDGKIDPKAEKPKMVKIKAGDKDIELDANGLVTVKIRDKDESVPMKELISNYSGKVDWTKKYNEVNTIKQKVDNDRAILDKTVSEFKDLAYDKKDLVGAVNYLGKLLDIDLEPIWDAAGEAFMQRAEELVKLSPEERKQKELEEKLTKYKLKDERERQTKDRERTMTNLSRQVDDLQKAYGIDNQRFYEVYEALRDTKIYKEHELTPEKVAEFHVELKRAEGITELVKELSPDTDEKVRLSQVTELLNTAASHPDLTDADLKEIAIEVYGNKAAKNLSNKLKKTKPIDTAKPTKAQTDNPWDFDQLQ